MSTLQVRKLHIIVEDALVEGGKALDPVLRRVAVAAVLRNPYAGRYVDDLSPLFSMGEEIGAMLSRRAIEALGPGPYSYGKAGIVGTAGEIEHCAALLHPQLGRPLRASVGGGKAVIPSTTKRGGPGTSIDIPLHFKDDEWRFDSFDAIEIRVPDAPAPDEVVIAVALTNGGRPHARIGTGRR